jgi:hypothetical protein
MPTGAPPIVSFADDRLRIDHWYPRLEPLTVRTLETVFVDIETKASGQPVWDDDAVRTAAQGLSETPPVFVRTMYKAALSSVAEGSTIGSYTPEAIQETLSALFLDLFGTPYPHGERLALREYVDLDRAPDTRVSGHPELRAYLRDGEVVQSASRSDVDTELFPDVHSQMLDSLDEHEVRVEPQLERVAEAFAEAPWCVDFVLTTDDEWVCTDMSLDGVWFDLRDETWKALSYHPPDSVCNPLDEYGAVLPPADAFETLAEARTLAAGSSG